MRFASIDIGTNSTRLLIFSRKNIEFHILTYQERLTKLGAGLTTDKKLSMEAMQRVLLVLQEFQQLLAQYKVEQVKIFATSAVRDASNQTEFLQLVQQHCNLHIRVLSGNEEAYFTFLGAISDLSPSGNFLVCDIGGGSTEFIFAQDQHILKTISIDMGSGRLTRQFFPDDPPSPQNIAQAEAWVKKELTAHITEMPVEQIISTGGTAATLAMMKNKVPITEPFKIHHSKLDASDLHVEIIRLQNATWEERQRFIGLHPQRADVMLGGALILYTILQFFKSTTITSLHDLMYGVWIQGDISW